MKPILNRPITDYRQFDLTAEDFAYIDLNAVEPEELEYDVFEDSEN